MISSRSQPAAPDWDRLAASCRSCTRCPELVASRTAVVVGAAPPGATLALVGEAPGAAEDHTGTPFVGRAGRLLDELLAGAGLNRGRVAVLNTLKCRPPGNRRPAAAELAACRPWLTDQLAVVAPRLVVALGLTAAGWFLGPGARLADLRGRVHPAAGTGVLVTYHPSAALRFGPRGEPARLLAADLAWAAQLVAGGAAL